MADCLPNAAELVEELKKCADCAGVYCTEFCGEKLFEISDFVEALLAENAKLKAERDAAMRTIPHDCNTCSKDCDITIAHKALLTKRCDNWEWRGVQDA